MLIHQVDHYGPKPIARVAIVLPVGLETRGEGCSGGAPPPPPGAEEGWWGPSGASVPRWNVSRALPKQPRESHRALPELVMPPTGGDPKAQPPSAAATRNGSVESSSFNVLWDKTSQTLPTTTNHPPPGEANQT